MKCHRMRTHRCGLFTLTLSLVAGILASATFSPRASAQDAGSADVLNEARTNERNAAYADAELALSRRLLDQAVTRADAVVKLMTALRQEVEALTQRVAKLNDGDEGKRLASTLDEYAARDVIKMLDTPAVDAEKLAANLTQVGDLLVRLKAERERVVAGYVPPEAVISELDSLMTWARQQRSNVRDKNEWLDQRLLGVAAGFDPAKAPILRESLLQFRRRELAAHEAIARDGAQKAKAEGDAALGEAARSAELERRLQEARLRLEEARAELSKQKAEHEQRIMREQDQTAQSQADLNAELAKNDAERAKQEAKSNATRERGVQDAQEIARREAAANPRVRQVLAPFTARGYYQPGRGMTTDSSPVSLNALSRHGALARTDNGVLALVRVAVDSHDKQRPRWAMKTYLRGLTPSQIEMAKEAQTYLIDYGDILVEQGVLAP